MSARLVMLSLTMLAACSSAPPTTDESPAEQTASGSQVQEALIIEPLVPKQALPPGTDLHYDFAHILLPLVVFTEPRDMVRRQFLGDSADLFLRKQWEAIHQEAPSAFPTAKTVKLEVGDAALITMPTPQKNAHAYFMLVVFKASGPIRYMTLERSVFMKDDDPRRTVIGEWSVGEEGPEHANFGEGPPPEQDIFLEAVLDYVR